MPEGLRALGLMVLISWRADAPRSVLAVITGGLQMTTLPVRAIGLRLFTDGIVQSNVALATEGVVVVVGLTAASRLMGWASLNVRMRLRENTQLYLDSYLMQLTAGIPGIEHHERPEYLDNIERVRAERWALVNPFNPISWSLASIVQVASVVILLQSVHPLLLLLPLAGIPSIAATMRAQRKATELREAQAEPGRLLRHLLELPTEAAAAKEIRIFGLGRLLRERHRSLWAELERAQVAQRVRMTALTSLAWMFFSGCFVAAIAFTVDLAVRREVSVGAVMLVLGLGASINLQLGILVGNIGWLIRTQSAVMRLIWLRDYARQAQAGSAPSVPAGVPDQMYDGIRLSGVSFCYPGLDVPVLRSVDLHLPAGSTVAIVGENGAGKTTLVKLLSRFYDPTAGSITVDGVDLQQMPVLEWRGRLAAGFQDFARLQLLARESIGVGDIDRIGHDRWILDALERAAAGDLADGLPGWLDTQLGRYFEGGVDLSLGEWQKVALSRAMMRQRILLLMLDEPTASLDAPTEHALFEHFASAARDYARAAGAITLLVSHRFSTVRMADLILVVADGRIVERGSHAELVQQNGLYAELYGLQARAYR
jgi:ATP-binding cassette, subfamily B, bacterial